MADVVAMANTRGGTIYVGVSAVRKGLPRGVENAVDAAALLRRECERRVTPLLDVRVDVVESMGASVVRATVPNGMDKPYALEQTHIYVRQEGETNEAVRDEVVQLVLSQRSSAQAAAPEVPPAGAVAEKAGPRETSVDLESASAKAARLPETALKDGNALPAVGVEVLAAEERKGTKYFSIRDLRNGNLIHNVSPASARKLWSYAIDQYLTNPVDPARVTWHGNLGLWQVARRAKRLRYDLVQRQDGASMRVFYGVTADGMPGLWQQFLQDEDKAE
jgi:hypothetical protein